MRVLFASHTGLIGGAEHALLDVLAHLPASIDPVVACPSGPLGEAVARAGHTPEPLPAVSASLRLHPGRTPAALVELASAARECRRVARRTAPDVVHANSTRAGLAVAATPTPSLVWVHDALADGAASRLVARAVAATATRVAANSAHAARSFEARAPGSQVSVVHNGVDLARFDPVAVSREDARARLGLAPDEPVLGIVAQITPWKGHDVAIDALAAVRRTHPTARLLVVGEPKFVGRDVRHDNLAFLAALKRTVAEHGLQDAVAFLGEREDVPQVLRALDLLLAPSWEEPFGRVVIEAMAMGTPVLATAVGGPAEVLEDGRTGRLLAPRRADLWAAAIAELLGDPGRRAELAAAARREVPRFELSACVNRLVEEYRLASEA